MKAPFLSSHVFKLFSFWKNQFLKNNAGHFAVLFLILSGMVSTNECFASSSTIRAQNTEARRVFSTQEWQEIDIALGELGCTRDNFVPNVVEWYRYFTESYDNSIGYDAFNKHNAQRKALHWILGVNSSFASFFFVSINRDITHVISHAGSELAALIEVMPVLGQKLIFFMDLGCVESLVKRGAFSSLEIFYRENSAFVKEFVKIAFFNCYAQDDINSCHRVVTRLPWIVNDLAQSVTADFIRKAFCDNTGRDMISYMIQEVPSLCSTILQNGYLDRTSFVRLVEEAYPRDDLLRRILHHADKNTLVAMSSWLTKDLVDNLLRFEVDCGCLTMFLEHDHELAQRCSISITQDQFVTMCRSPYGRAFLCCLVVADKRYASIFADYIIGGLCEDLTWYIASGEVISCICRHDSKQADRICSLFDKNFVAKAFAYGSAGVYLIEKVIPFKLELCRFLDELVANKFFTHLRMRLGNHYVAGIYAHLEIFELLEKMYPGFMEEFAWTPTVRHLLNCPLDSRGTQYTDPELAFLVLKCVQQEKQFQETHYTFVHGQHSDYYLSEQLYTLFWSVRNKCAIQNFIFAHLKPPSTLQERVKEENLRFKILEKGRFDDESRQHLLFLNYAFFANYSNPGSCTAYYVAHNRNAGDIGKVETCPAKVFNYYGLDELYKRYAQELEHLETRFRALHPYGVTLMVAVPKEYAQDVVFPAYPGGARRTIERIKQSDARDIHEVMKTLLEKPEELKDCSDVDVIEFCLFMGRERGGMNPNLLQIVPLTIGDPLRLAEFERDRKELFERIKADLMLAFA